jgi:hypothetical protein
MKRLKNNQKFIPLTHQEQGDAFETTFSWSPAEVMISIAPGSGIPHQDSRMHATTRNA